MFDFTKELYTQLSWYNRETNREIREEKRYQRKLRKAIRKSNLREKKYAIDKINSENRYVSERRKKFTTTKFFMYFILINCTIIEIYSMVTMYLLQDLSALYSLIGAVVGEGISYAIYCAKSFNESKEECRNKLERDKFEASISNSNCPKADDVEITRDDGDLS